MKGNCEKCQLPIIIETIEVQKNAALGANSNITASTTPTEAAPFIKLAEDAVAELRDANTQLRDFLYIWSGYCSGCEYGA